MYGDRLLGRRTVLVLYDKSLTLLGDAKPSSEVVDYETHTHVLYDEYTLVYLSI